MPQSIDVELNRQKNQKRGADVKSNSRRQKSMVFLGLQPRKFSAEDVGCKISLEILTPGTFYVGAEAPTEGLLYVP